MTDKDSVIIDDSELLMLISSAAEQTSDLYKPGQYWANTSLLAKQEIAKYGLNGFRGTNSCVAMSFGDNELIDNRVAYRRRAGSFLKLCMTKIPLFNQVLEAQVSLTTHFYKQQEIYKNAYLRNSMRVEELIRKYPVSKMETTRGGSECNLEVGGVHISHHYLQLLDTLDVMMSNIGCISLSKTNILEIGGGFGANVHLMVELFGAKKIIYLDISPNLYVATQYLKSFYGSAVVDYKMLQVGEIGFRQDDSLEILCILPHQIECIEADIELFHNAHSFVEMPESVIRNYAGKLSKIMNPESGVIYLVSYDGFDLRTSINPSRLPSFFGRLCSETTVETLRPSRYNFHFYCV